MTTNAHLLIYPVVLSGGSGTRLWPLSQPERPKQFIPLVGELSMMQDTLARTASRAGFAAPIIVSSKKHASIIAEQVADLDLETSAIFLEPQGRNTAAAIALAAFWLLDRTPDALMLVMPSDHVIGDLPSFYRVIDSALPAAGSGRLVTFGIQPTHPETGYGYIERGDALDGMTAAYDVAAFVEKPELEAAQAYIASGRYYWNGGIFLFSARSFIEELERYAPQVASACRESVRLSRAEGVMISPDEAMFATCPDVSIDYAVMENTTRAAVIPADMQWSDVGSWDALWEIRNRDCDHNTVRGTAIMADSSGNLVYIDGGPPVAIVGVTDSVIVSTAQGILVMPRSRSQDVKLIVEQVKAGRLAAVQ